MSFNLEVFFNPEDDYEGNRTTKVFVLSSQKMTNETGNVALVTVLTSVFVHNIGFQIAGTLSLLRKRFPFFGSENSANFESLGKDFVDVFDVKS